jgi:hypothetical protein
MADDTFVPSPPEFNIYVSDDEGNIDFKDRGRSGGLWKREKDGKVYFAGKVGGKRVVMFPNEAKTEEKEQW